MGTVYLRSNLKEIDRQLVQVGSIALIVMTVSLGIAMLITGWLQKLFTAPIHELAKVMEYISAGGDTSISVKKHGRDEMGVLFDGFNRMLHQINAAHDGLLHAHNELEQRVVERTENLRAEVARRRQAQQELARAREAAETSNFAKSEFLANMSHEIRTPMTAILGFSEVVLNNVSNPQNVEGLKTIQRNGQYLLDLINDILDLSKIESGKLIVEQIECSPCQVLADVASLMGVRASAKGLTLEFEYDGPIPQSIQSDPTRLRQILINLTGNAIKFTEVGKIRVLARMLDGDSDEPKLQFEVVDTGIGITDQQIDKLFQPFVQADSSTTRKFGGTGLGLAISRRLAEMLGGNIRVHSIPGQGSTFSATVSTGPLEGVKMVDNFTEAEAPAEHHEKPAGGNVRLDGRVLLAEDGPDNQRLIAFVLKKAGADVTVTENGQLALDLALAARDKGSPFDVNLMDMQMPVLDGYQATAKLREAGYAGPIIALTAHAMSGDRDKCLNAGCDEYTTKPIVRQQLISLVAQHISRQKLYKANDNKRGERRV